MENNTTEATPWSSLNHKYINMILMMTVKIGLVLMTPMNMMMIVMIIGVLVILVMMY